MRPLLVAVTVALAAAPLAAQQASLTYLLGKDTLAVEQWSRTATALTGEMVQRSGPAVIRVQYRLALGRDGRPTGGAITRLAADGTPLPNNPRETRFTVTADSIVREAVFADSTQRRAFAAKNGMINFPTFVYGPTEVLAAIKRGGGAVDSLPAVGIGGGLGFTGLTSVTSSGAQSQARLRGSVYPMLLTFDGRDRLQSVDGSLTTNKVLAQRGSGADIAAIAKAMKPTGTLSGRADARAGFGAGGMVVIDYGRPQVRERTVWGGTLIPMDSIWRAGANDATHLFTTRTLTFGSALSLSPGMYTLWVQHTAGGTYLIVNRQTGQWGTQYDASQDVGRVMLEMKPAAEHVEEFTITVVAVSGTSGRIELAWGDKVASVPFTASVARP